MAAPKRSQAAEFVVAGSAACCAITFMNPVDVVKTRLQLQGELAAKASGAAKEKAYRGVAHALWRIGRTEGLRGLQRGLGAAYLLQFSNVGCRFGGYSVLKEAFGVQPGSSTGNLTLLAMGAASGALAGVVSNPFFLLKTRFQAAGSADVSHEHGARTLRQAFGDIAREEGVSGYYRGLPVFVLRVMAASSVQLSTYDVIKAKVLSWTGAADGIPVHFGSSLLTGIAVTLAMQPFDFTAVRLMNQQVKADGTGALYSGPVDCLAKTLRTEGPLGVYKGTFANYLRFGPYCTLTFIFVEQLRTGWDRAAAALAR